MIDKETATAHGVTMLDNTTILQDDTAQRIEALKRILPACINSDNQLNTQALQDILNIANTTSNNKGYELTFAGKGIARAMANTETTKELQTEQAQSKHFDTTGNIVLRGDNIDALKILYQNYYGKIKMIYIDPPYNTTSDTFIYNDNFKQSEEALIEAFGLGEETTNFLHNVYGTKSHSGWLAFMYPRLTLARDLLTDDGVIFISIDDNEQANLKILCDEIYGEDNFVGEIVRICAEGGGLAKHLVKGHDNLLIYSKQKSSFIPLKKEKDIRGKITVLNGIEYWIEEDWLRKEFGKYGTCYYEEIEKVKGKDKKNEIDKGLEEGKYILLSKKNGLHIVGRYRRVDEDGTKFYSILKHLNKIGNEELEELNIPFSNPKPKSLLIEIIKGTTFFNNKSEYIILDFFAGSGTTGDAVMQLNAEDGGNRKFILVQLDETIDKKKHIEAYTFCTEHNMPPVISSICIERLNRAGEKIHKAWQEQRGLDASHGTLDIGYKVFSLTDKPRVIQDEQQAFKITNERSGTLDTLYNMLTATCKTLDTPIETIIKDTLYQCDHELYLIAPVEQETLEPYKDQKINIDAYANINLETFLNLGVATSDNVTVVF